MVQDHLYKYDTCLLGQFKENSVIQVKWLTKLSLPRSWNFTLMENCIQVHIEGETQEKGLTCFIFSYGLRLACITNKEGFKSLFSHPRPHWN